MSTPPPPWNQQLVDHYRLYRDYLQHEDDLINHRSTWHNTIQGLLFTALGVIVQWKPEATNPRAVALQVALFILIPILGAIIGASAFLSIDAATRALDELGRQWNLHLETTYLGALPFLPTLAGAGDTYAIAYGKAPALVIPLSITFTWIVLLGVSLRTH